jgi:hypothetical protein
MNSLQVVSALVELTSTLVTISARLQQASQTIQRAHVESWSPGDPRWEEAFSEADKALTDALARLKAGL